MPDPIPFLNTPGIVGPTTRARDPFVAPRVPVPDVTEVPDLDRQLSRIFDGLTKVHAERIEARRKADSDKAKATGISDEYATALAEAHRQHIDRWFYPCDATMHAGLADLYENDARFAANIDVHGDGLTPYLVAAIRANGDSVR